MRPSVLDYIIVDFLGKFEHSFSLGPSITSAVSIFSFSEQRMMSEATVADCYFSISVIVMPGGLLGVTTGVNFYLLFC